MLAIVVLGLIVSLIYTGPRKRNRHWRLLQAFYHRLFDEYIQLTAEQYWKAFDEHHLQCPGTDEESLCPGLHRVFLQDEGPGFGLIYFRVSTFTF